MTHRAALPQTRDEKRRPTCNVEQARERLCPDEPPSRQHIYNLINRQELDGYFMGNRRGLRIYVDSIDKLLEQNTAEAALGDSIEAING